MPLTGISILVLGVIVAVVSGMVEVRKDRRRLARAGIGPDTPGCAECLYPLGAWSGPACPECGADVTEHGVRVGPASRRIVVSLLAAGLAVAAGLPVSFAGLNWLLRDVSVREQLELSSLVDPPLRAVAIVEGRDRRLPPLKGWTVRIDLYDLPAAPGGGGAVLLLGGAVAASPDGAALVPAASVRFDDPSAIEADPSAAAGVQLIDAIETASAGRITRDAAATHAEVLLDMARNTAGRRVGPGSNTSGVTLRDTALPPWTSGSLHIRWRSPVQRWRTATILLLVVVTTSLFAWFVVTRLRRRLPDGRRPARAGEWGEPSGAG